MKIKNENNKLVQNIDTDVEILENLPKKILKN